MDIDKIYNIDCLEGMKMIPDGSVDCIICDLPYGTMKGNGKGVEGFDEHKHDWDEIIPTAELFEQYGRVLRRGGRAILFSQEPYTSHLRQFKGTWMEFCYPMIWKKDASGMALNAKNAPMSYFEDINVFEKRNANDAEKAHPLRPYAKALTEWMGKGEREVLQDFKEWNIEHPTRVSHFLGWNSLQFKLCTAETYDLFIKHYGIDKWEGFRSWEDLNVEDKAFADKGRKVFNLPEGKSSMSNVLEFSKDTDGFHPTQKPVALIRRLIQTYSNEGDTILDNCMGSGTTAIAAIREKRHFIGFELNAEYYKKAQRRIEIELSKTTLF